uniref:Uncharacterized protein n=1 Tax=Cyclophora tenuis TaxID=216820 RepID=A0A7S1CX85_CYCTE|mmetsp:Transcript_13230/g.22509  ORF Transcript_13230/g.22509 Transcript_13230/m.22509 type:complete len:276 (+) Transcript_13230:148-975(+)
MANENDEEKGSSGTGEEVQLLKDMINERDKKIREIRRKLEWYEKKKARLGASLKDVKELALTQREDNKKTIADFTSRKKSASAKLDQMEKDVMQQNGTLHTYADVLNKVESDNVDSSYVVRMQSQLCKAMHSMGILEHQLSIVKEYGSETVKNLKEGMNSIVEEKSNMELELMNQLVAIDDEKRSMEDAYKTKVETERDEIQKALGEDDEEEEEGEEEEEDDNEEEIDEDLLKEILEERQEEIRQIEAENEKRAKKIKEMQGKIERRQEVQSDVQ